MYHHSNQKYEDELLLKILSIKNNLEELKSGLQADHIMDCWATLDYLNQSNSSFSRFGDGEFSVAINGQSNVFQEYDELLAKKLREVLLSKEDGFLVGVNYYWFNEPIKLHDRQMLFYLTTAPQYRQILKDYLDDKRVYGESAISMPYMLYKDMDFEKYYSKLELLWKDKDIVLICGETIFDKLKHNIFLSAKSIEYIYAPHVNAFRQYDQILSKALATDSSKVKFIILGQTATVLAYDLFKNGHRAIDIGHSAKDYNAYKEKLIVDIDSCMKFFDKD